MRPLRKVPAVRMMVFPQEGNAQLSNRASHAVAFEEQIIDWLLEDRKVGLVFEAAADGLPVENSVGLGTRCPDRRPFAGIEDPELDAGFICGGRHGPA